MGSAEKTKIAIRVTLIGLIVNILLAAFKIISGILGMSMAVLSDGIHTVLDSISDIITILGIKISRKPKDDSHHYGQGKFETLVLWPTIFENENQI